MLYADHDRDMEKGSVMTDIDRLKSDIRNSYKSVKEIVNFNEFSVLFETESPHLWYLPFDGYDKYLVWESTVDGGTRQLECTIDDVGRIVASRYLGVVYFDEG